MTIAQDPGFSYSPSDSSPETNPGSMLYDDDLRDSFLDEKPLKSASLASRKGPGPAAADKRATHNAIERARRESLNGRFMTLAEALPSMANVKRPSKSNIVNKALDFVYDAQIKEHKLIEENNMLRREVDQLRARLGMAPLPPPQPLISPSDAREKKTKQQKQKQQAEATAAARREQQQQQQQNETAKVEAAANASLFAFGQDDVASISGSSFSSPASMHSSTEFQRATPELVDHSSSMTQLSQQVQSASYAPSPIDSVSSSSPSNSSPLIAGPIVVPTLTSLVPTSSASNTSSPYLAHASIASALNGTNPSVSSAAAANANHFTQQQQAFLQAQAAQTFGAGNAFMSPSLLSHQQSLIFAAQAAQFQHQANQFHAGMDLYGAGVGGGMMGNDNSFPWSNGGYSPFAPFVMSG